MRYEIGRLDDGMHVSVQQSNPADGWSELALYRQRNAWDLHEPRTTVHLSVDGRTMAPSRCLALRPHDDRLRRSDVHTLDRNTGDNRLWAQLVVDIGAQERRVWMPSSLFRSQHGHSPR